jgi:hypothetical protein
MLKGVKAIIILNKLRQSKKYVKFTNNNKNQKLDKDKVSITFNCKKWVRKIKDINRNKLNNKIHRKNN